VQFVVSQTDHQLIAREWCACCWSHRRRWNIVMVYLLVHTNSTEQRPFWETDSSSTGQKTYRALWKPQWQKSTATGPYPKSHGPSSHCHIISVKMHLTICLLSTLTPPKWYILFNFSDKNAVRINYEISHYVILFSLLSLPLSYFLIITHFSNTLNPLWFSLSLRVRDKVWHPYKITEKQYAVIIQ
jgi:hypothetical protein